MADTIIKVGSKKNRYSGEKWRPPFINRRQNQLVYEAGRRSTSITRVLAQGVPAPFAGVRVLGPYFLARMQRGIAISNFG